MTEAVAQFSGAAPALRPDTTARRFARMSRSDRRPDAPLMLDGLPRAHALLDVFTARRLSPAPAVAEVIAEPRCGAVILDLPVKPVRLPRPRPQRTSGRIIGLSGALTIWR
jgi:hypothetical protein